MIHPSTSSSSPSAGHRAKDIFSVIVGHILEYFDMMLFVHLLMVMTPLFFPCGDHFAERLAGVIGFSVTYIARPLGTVFFGYIGDKRGRVYALNISLLLMALGTGSIGLLPTYAQVGIYAPIALVVCRILQGISSAGEPVGASIFLIESPAFATRKCFLSSMVNASAALGGVLAASLGFFFVSRFGEQSGWKYPFLIGACIGLYGVFLRYQLRESGLFQKAQKDFHKTHPQEFSLLEILRNHYRQILCVMGMSAMNPMGFYLTYVYGPDLLKAHTGMSTTSILGHSSMIMLLDAALSLMTGLLSDRFGARRICSFLSLGLVVFAYPLFAFVLGNHPTYLSITLWQVGILILCSAYETPLRPLIMTLFPTVGRYSAYGIGWSIGRVLSYSIGTYSCLFLQRWVGTTGPAFLLLLLGSVAFAALYLARPLYRIESVKEELMPETVHAASGSGK